VILVEEKVQWISRFVDGMRLKYHGRRQVQTARIKRWLRDPANASPQFRIEMLRQKLRRDRIRDEVKTAKAGRTRPSRSVRRLMLT
jgi:hypothetical protein